MTQVPKCPKCGGQMIGNKRLATYTLLTLKNETEFQGDAVLTFYCTHCGYIELYRADKNK